MEWLPKPMEADGRVEGLGLWRLCRHKNNLHFLPFHEEEEMPGRRTIPYRFEATTIEGFVQQVAVQYVARGYWFYVSGIVPEAKDPRAVAEKLIGKYGFGVSKFVRARRKLGGHANLQLILFGRIFLLLATHGDWLSRGTCSGSNRERDRTRAEGLLQREGSLVRGDLGKAILTASL